MLTPPSSPPAATAEREDQTELDCDDAEISCPLYDWQTEHAEPAVQDRDTTAIAAVLHQIEFYAPVEDWNEGETAGRALPAVGPSRPTRAISMKRVRPAGPHDLNRGGWGS